MGNFVICRIGVEMGRNLAGWLETAPKIGVGVQTRDHGILAKFLRLGLQIINFRINYVRLKMYWTENWQRKIAPGAISSFVVTVSEWAEIWQVD